jgi:hypothetical protein
MFTIHILVPVVASWHRRGSRAAVLAMVSMIAMLEEFL